MSSEVKITLRGGTVLTPEEAKEAIDKAFQLIEKIGTTGINHAHKGAYDWIKKYYPGYE